MKVKLNLKPHFENRTMLLYLKWMSVFFHFYFIADFITKDALIRWNRVCPSDWPFWLTLDVVFIGVSFMLMVTFDALLLNMVKVKRGRPRKNET